MSSNLCTDVDYTNGTVFQWFCSHLFNQFLELKNILKSVELMYS